MRARNGQLPSVRAVTLMLAIFRCLNLKHSSGQTHIRFERSSLTQTDTFACDEAVLAGYPGTRLRIPGTISEHHQATRQ